MEVNGTYQHQRSRAEANGDPFSEGFCEVMDLDRAIMALRRINPIAAMLVTLFRDGWTMDEINTSIGRKLHTPPARLVDKSIAFLSAYLSGADEKAQREAYRRGRKPRT